MRRFALLCWGLTIALLAATAGGLLGDEPSPWQKLFRTHAKEYRFTTPDGADAAFELVAEPVMQWSQPVRGGDDGAVFLWTHDGHPAALGAMFIWPMGDGRQGVTHEMHALGASEFRAIRRKETWSPPAQPTFWKTLEGAPKPADTPEKRGRQMRELAGSFQIETARDNETWELRLLPKPFYRDPAPQSAKLADGEVLDGALFAMVEGTDLEVAIGMRARQVDGVMQWEWSAARMTDLAFKVIREGKTVYEAERIRDFGVRDKEYIGSMVESRREP